MVQNLFIEFSDLTNHASGEAANGQELNFAITITQNESDFRSSLEVGNLVNKAQIDLYVQNQDRCVARRGNIDNGAIVLAHAVIRLDLIETDNSGDDAEAIKRSCIVESFLHMVGFSGSLSKASQFSSIPREELVKYPFHYSIRNSLLVLYDKSIPPFTMRHEIIDQVRAMMMDLSVTE